MNEQPTEDLGKLMNDGDDIARHEDAGLPPLRRGRTLKEVARAARATQAEFLRAERVAKRAQRRASRLAERAAKKEAVAARKFARKPLTQFVQAATQALAVSTSVDDEIMALVATLHERSRDLVLRRWGYSEWPPAKLESLGEHYGITRERVRQITSGHEELVLHAALTTPKVSQLPSLLSASGGVLSGTRFSDVLHAAGISISSPALRVAQKLSELGLIGRLHHDDEYDLWFDDATYTRLVTTGRYSDVLATVRSRGRRQLRRMGAVSTVRLAQAVPLDAIEAGQLIWGDAATTSVSGYVVPHAQHDSALSRAVVTMLAVTPTLSLSDIADGLARVSPKPVKLPVPALAAVLSHHAAFAVRSGGMVSLVEPVSRARVLRSAEIDVVDAMEAAGGVMTWNEIRVVLLTRGHTLAWLRILALSPYVCRLGRRLYALRGRLVPRGVEDLVASAAIERREWSLAHAESPSDTQCTLRYRVTATTLRGVLTLPRRAQAMTSTAPSVWEATSDGASPDQVSIGAGMLWNLASWMARAGAVAGDHVAVSLDADTNTVHLARIPKTQAERDELAWAALPTRPLGASGPLRFRSPRIKKPTRVRRGRLVYDDRTWVRLPVDTSEPPPVECFRLGEGIHPAQHEVLIVIFTTFPLPPETTGARMGVMFDLPAHHGRRRGAAGLIEAALLTKGEPLTYEQATAIMPNLSQYLWRKRCALVWREYQQADAPLHGLPSGIKEVDA